MDLVEEMTAREAIRQAALRYCRGVDRLDVAMMQSAYHIGAIDDHGVYVGDAMAFCERVVESHRRFAATMHCILNHTIELDDPSHARGEIYNISHILRAVSDGTKAVDTWYGRYLDRYECREGRWAISYRICVHEWTRSDPITQTMDIAFERFKQGSYDRATGALLGPGTFGG